jgi:hypothetical protein
MILVLALGLVHYLMILVLALGLVRYLMILVLALGLVRYLMGDFLRRICGCQVAES